jgi:type VI secretion system secreted protein Hcp
MAVRSFLEANAMNASRTSLNGFIKIGDFEGGSADNQHAGWSDITGLDCEITRKIGSFIKSQNPVGSTELSDVCVLKLIDGSTPKIQKACASGQKLSKVVIHVTSVVNGQSKVTLEYELQDAIVAQYAIGSKASSDSGSSTSRQEGGPPLERVCFSFAKISWTFHKMDALGNSQGKIQESYAVGS